MTTEIEPFRIAFVSGVTLSKWTRVWAERHPHVPLQVAPTDDAAQVAELRERRADVAFVRLPIDDAGLSVIPLYSEQAFIVVPREHPIALFDSVTLADLADETVLDWDFDSGPDSGSDSGPDSGSGSGPEGAVSVVAANVGVAIMPQSLARLHARKDVVSRPISDAPETRIALAWLAEETTVRIEDFIGIVRGRTARSSRGAAPEPTVAPVRPRQPKRPDRRPSPKRRSR